MAVGLLARLAAGAPVPVLPIAGAGGRDAVAALRARTDVELVASPRHATVVLVAGALPESLVRVVRAVHDQVPGPRGLVWWGGVEGVMDVPGAEVVAPEADVVDALSALHRDLLTDRRDSTPRHGPAQNPTSWRGEGPHGQGGEGMMGGTPYGRAMAMTGEDLRDGLQLDRVPLTVGPALPGFPPGLVLEVELQGDVLVSVTLGDNPFLAATWHGAPLGGSLRATASADAGPAVADARRALLRLADGVALAGLDALAARTARLAVEATRADADAVERHVRRLGRLPALWGCAHAVGVVGADLDLPSRYHGDARSRWLRTGSRAVAALRDERQAPTPDDGADTTVVLDVLPHLLTGMEWGDAVMTIASLDLDLAAAADQQAAAA